MWPGSGNFDMILNTRVLKYPTGNFYPLYRCTRALGSGTLENHRHVNAWSSGTSVGLETGGSAVQVASRHQAFTVPTAVRPPELLFFQAKAGCIAAAVTVAETEACLVDTNPPTGSPANSPTTSSQTALDSTAAPPDSTGSSAGRTRKRWRGSTLLALTTWAALVTI